MQINFIRFGIYSILLGFALTSCQQSNYIDKQGVEYKPGTIISGVKAASDSSTHFDVYIPKKFSGNQRLPIVLFFDPHADSRTPLEKYKEIADKNNFIMVASTNMRNGLPGDLSQRYYQTTLQEIMQRMPVDKGRIVLAGFSGGAKLAMMFAQDDKNISGVIACGGTIPPVSGSKPAYHLSAIIGLYDFNYLEFRQTLSRLSAENYDYTALTFEGGHAWPNASCFELAWAGQELFAVKLRRAELNKQWLSELKNRMEDSVETKIATQREIEAFEYAGQMARWLNGIEADKEWKTKSTRIESGESFARNIQKIRQMANAEMTIRTEYIRALNEKDSAWWNSEINGLQSTTKVDIEKYRTSKRLLNYLSMASFMLVKSDFENNLQENALEKLSVYKRVDPQNPDVFLMYALYYLQMGNSSAMTENFREALRVGFNAETYRNEPFWKPLMNNSEIQNLQQ